MHCIACLFTMTCEYDDRRQKCRVPKQRQGAPMLHQFDNGKAKRGSWLQNFDIFPLKNITGPLRTCPPISRRPGSGFDKDCQPVQWQLLISNRSGPRSPGMKKFGPSLNVIEYPWTNIWWISRALIKRGENYDFIEFMLSSFVIAK